ncbi:MAG TPA: hypothetical protein V6C96_00735, partial [Vampirovibrionales bacterium]
LEIINTDEHKITFRDKATNIEIYTTCKELWPGVNYVITVALESNKVNQTQLALIKDLSNISVEVKSLVKTESENKSSVIFDEKTRKFTNKFVTTFKDCKAFFGRTYFTDFPVWVGYIREIVLGPIRKEIVNDLKGGKYGMVTNTSSINIYNEAETFDEVIGQVWITKESDFDRSFIDLSFEWLKKGKDGLLVKLADCKLSTTWVEIVGHGLVKVSPIPAYFLKFLETHKTKDLHDKNQKLLLQEYVSTKDLGEVEYQTNSIIRPDVMLSKSRFQTGIFDSNLVGNLYYSNYYDWQAKTTERYLFKFIPEIFTNQGKLGEFICLESKVNHIQEAMPFEEIVVKVYLENLYSNGFKLFFEYFSCGMGDGNTERKLASGSNTFIWAKRTDEHSAPSATTLPPKLKQAFVEAVNRSLTQSNASI